MSDSGEGLSWDGARGRRAERTDMMCGRRSSLWACLKTAARRVRAAMRMGEGAVCGRASRTAQRRRELRWGAASRRARRRERNVAAAVETGPGVQRASRERDWRVVRVSG